MAKSCWSLLGVKKGATERDIKVAYAKRLKVTRPEDDAEAFQRLVEARDIAVGYARSRTTGTGQLADGATPAVSQPEPENSKTKQKPRTRKPRKAKQVRETSPDHAPTPPEHFKLTPDDATKRISAMLSEPVPENGIAAFDEALAVLRNAAFAERTASEEELLWEIGKLADLRFPDQDEAAAAPEHLDANRRYMVSVLAEEFRWADDEHRIASMTSWHSPRLLDLIHEAHYGPQIAPQPLPERWWTNVDSIWFLVLLVFFLLKVFDSSFR